MVEEVVPGGELLVCLAYQVINTLGVISYTNVTVRCKSLYSILRVRGTAAATAFVCTAMQFSASNQTFSSSSVRRCSCW